MKRKPYMNSLCRGIVLAMITAALTSCGKSGDAGSTTNTEIRYARYPIALYSKAGSTAKTDYVTTLTKTERVEVEGKEEVSVNKGSVSYLRVHAAGNKTGFAEERHFASEVAVVLSDNPKLLQRPVVTAGKGFNAEAVIPGAIAFIEGRSEEAETWFEISGSSPAGNFRGWIRSADISRDFNTVTDAVLLERAIAQYGSTKESEKEEGKKTLEELQTNPNAAIAGLAAKALEGDSESTETEKKPEAPVAPTPPAY